MLSQSVLLLVALCGIAQTAIIYNQDYELEEDVTCKNTEECTRVSKCASAVDTVDNKLKHHRYVRCGWYGDEEVICCPKEEKIFPYITTRLKPKNAKEACIAFTKTRIFPGQGQIIGGVPAIAGEFPHMAALGYSRNGSVIVWGKCGGSLISYDYVLTAAHCLSAPSDNAQVTLDVFAVRLGKLDIAEGSDDLTPQDLKVNKVYSSEYNANTRYNDIALLRLEKSATINEYVSPACLYLHQTDPKEHIIVSGWGVTSTSKEIKSSILLKTTLKAFDIISCSDRRKINPLAKDIITSQMCAVSYDDEIRDTCQGDSGGPAQVINGTALYVVGVTSYGQCGSTPGVYTRVASYVNWIESIVWS